MISTQPRARALMTSLSAGVLIFLLIEIAHKCLEMVEESAKSGLSGSTSATPELFGTLLVVGISVGLLGLTFFEERFMGMAKESDPAARSKRVSLMIAMGIGLHNFGEGLAIGQEYANGALSLAYLLVAGFALHNATEGFGIAAPLQTTKVDWKFLGIAGFVGGGPTVVGTLAGSAYTLPALELLALSLAAGSILYVVGELLHIGKMQGQHRTAMAGLLMGFFVAFGSEMVIEIGMAASANRMEPTETFQVEATEFHFSPANFTVNAGGTIRFEIRNTGKETHEFELLELKLEAVIPPGDKVTLTIPKAVAGVYKIQCDLPGHAEKGMTGELLVRK